MRKVPLASWFLVAFFFFGGLAFTAFEATRWIGIGQIWMVVAVVMAMIFLGVSGKWKGKLGGKFSSTSSGAPSGSAGGTDAAATIGVGDHADQLARLERLRQSGDLTDAEYQAQRQRIISESG
jgi:hypothetical protein